VRLHRAGDGEQPEAAGEHPEAGVNRPAVVAEGGEDREGEQQVEGAVDGVAWNVAGGEEEPRPGGGEAEQTDTETLGDRPPEVEAPARHEHRPAAEEAEDAVDDDGRGRDRFAVALGEMEGRLGRGTEGQADRQRGPDQPLLRVPEKGDRGSDCGAEQR
jgi:hypothetical protein